MQESTGVAYMYCTVVVHKLFMNTFTVRNLNWTALLFVQAPARTVCIYCTWMTTTCTEEQSSSWFELYLDSSCTGVQSPARIVQHPVAHCGWHAVPGAAGCSTLNNLIIWCVGTELVDFIFFTIRRVLLNLLNCLIPPPPTPFPSVSCGITTECTEWQWSLSGVLSFLRVNQPRVVRVGVHAPPLSLYLPSRTKV